MATLLPEGKQSFTTNGSLPLAGGKVYTYIPGTSTPKDTYTTSAASVANANPVILDSRGEATIFWSGAYDVILKTSADVTIWGPIRHETPEISGSAAAVLTDLASTSDAAKGDALVGVKRTATGAVATTLHTWIEGQALNVKTDFGAVGDGTADDTSAIQAAITAAAGRTVYFPAGTYKISSALTYTSRLSMSGIDGINLSSNSFDRFPVIIKCGTVSGYIFDQPDVIDGSGELSISNIGFDGRIPTGTGRSTTLQGLVKSSSTASKNSFFLRLDTVMFGNTDYAGAAALELTGQVTSECHNCFFALVPFGYGVKLGAANIVSTTVTFDKCTFDSLRQCYEIGPNVLDVTFTNCVFQSSVVVGAVGSSTTNVVESFCYHENIGYDASVTGLTTGLTARSLGITDSPTISGNVSAAYTCRWATIKFISPTFNGTVGGKKWFDGIGRAGSNFGGAFIVENASMSGAITNLFTADSDTPSSKGNFEYWFTAKHSFLDYFSAADARLISGGRLPILWSDTNIRPVEVKNGIFTLPSIGVGGLTALPTIYPSGGANAIGDVIEMAPSQYQQGVRSAYTCVVAGTTASRWNISDFVPSSLSGSVANAATLVVTASSKDNPGELHVWDVLASTGTSIESFYRVSMQAFSGSGQLNVQSIVVTKTMTFTMGWADPYTITVTNTSGSTLNIYARLVSVTSAHS